MIASNKPAQRRDSIQREPLGFLMGMSFTLPSPSAPRSVNLQKSDPSAGGQPMNNDIIEPRAERQSTKVTRPSTVAIREDYQRCNQELTAGPTTSLPRTINYPPPP